MKAILGAARTSSSVNYFMPFIAKVEEVLIAMLGFESAEAQRFATVMLNCM